MSTVMMAPERESLPVNDTGLGESQPTGALWSRQAACALVLVLTDTAAIAISIKVAILFRIYLLPRLDSHLALPTVSFSSYTVVSGWMWLVLLLFLGVEGLYTQRRSLWNEIGHLAKAIGLGVAAILAAVALAQLSPGVSRATILLNAISLLILLPVARYSAKWVLGKLGLWRKRILILGAANTARLVIRGLNSDPVLGYEVAGLLDDNPLKKGKCIGMCGGKHAFILGNLSGDSRAHETDPGPGRAHRDAGPSRGKVTGSGPQAAILLRQHLCGPAVVGLAHDESARGRFLARAGDDAEAFE